MIRITCDSDCYYCTIKLSYSLHLYDFHDTVIIPDIFVLWHWGNSSCLNSDYGDIRHIVYIWGFPCLDYSFDVPISRISNLSLYNWFYYIYFTWCLIACSCVSVLTIWFLIHALWLEFIDTRVLVPAYHVALASLLVGKLSPLDLNVQISEPGAYRLSQLMIRDAQGSVNHRQTVQRPFLSGPLLGSRVFFL